jgi:hypothetical protein
MKTILRIVTLIALALALSSWGRVPDCKFKDIPLHGRVKIVNSPAGAFQVKINNARPDLEVKLVQSCPTDCGEWQIVESGEDFDVQFVDSGEDFSIRFTESFPGIY